MTTPREYSDEYLKAFNYDIINAHIALCELLVRKDEQILELQKQIQEHEDYLQDQRYENNLRD